MNYFRIYNEIIEKGKKRKLKGYLEKHHIVPKCIGGPDKEENIVKLTAREHFICHLLLTRMYPDNSKLWYALDAMITLDLRKRRYAPSSRIIEEIKIKTSTAKKQTRWINKEGIRKKVLKQEVVSYISEGWKEGRGITYNKGKIAVVRDGKTSYIAKEKVDMYLVEGYKLGNTRKGSKCLESSTTHKGRVCINDGQQTKRVLKEDLNTFLLQGWKKGYHYKIDYTSRELPNNTGRVCIWKGQEERRVNKLQLQSYEKKGWKRGHNPKYKGKRS